MMSKLNIAPNVTNAEWCKLYYSLALMRALTNSCGDRLDENSEVETAEFAHAVRELMSSGVTEYCAHRFTLNTTSGLLDIKDLRN